ncbi:hypothetical protein CR513_44991, partial [Mucuna pruriens]
MHKAIGDMDTNGGNRKKELPSVQAQRKRLINSATQSFMNGLREAPSLSFPPNVTISCTRTFFLLPAQDEEKAKRL